MSAAKTGGTAESVTVDVGSVSEICDEESVEDAWCWDCGTDESEA